MVCSFKPEPARSGDGIDLVSDERASVEWYGNIMWHWSFQGLLRSRRLHPCQEQDQSGRQRLSRIDWMDGVASVIRKNLPVAVAWLNRRAVFRPKISPNLYFGQAASSSVAEGLLWTGMPRGFYCGDQSDNQLRMIDLRAVEMETLNGFWWTRYNNNTIQLKCTLEIEYCLRAPGAASLLVCADVGCFIRISELSKWDEWPVPVRQ